MVSPSAGHRAAHTLLVTDPLAVSSPASFAGTWLDRFDASVRRRPDHPAVEDEDGGVLTFAEVDGHAVSLAATIGSQVSRAGAPVAILLGHQPTAVTATVGVARAGCTFVGLDPAQPEARLAQMQAIAGAELCVVDRTTAALAEAIGFAGRLVDVGRTAAGGETRPAAPADPACVLFTSGSTGQPKGIVWGPGTLLKDANAGISHLGIAEHDRLALVLPFSFAAGLSVVTWGLAAGATLCLFDPRRHAASAFVSWVDRAGVTTLHTTPTMLRALVRATAPGQRYESVRLLTTCGEPLRWTDVVSVRPHLGPTATVVNWAGSTEIGVLALHQVRAGDPVGEGLVPAGHLVDGLRARIEPLDDAPDDGAAGELVVVSDLVADGYAGQPDELAKRFVVTSEGREYRTGDLATLGQDGILTLRGRADAAVKVRGYLVEPSEVEQALVDHAAVADAVVLPQTDDTGTVRLVAHVEPASGQLLSVPQLRGALRERLPEYMVPGSIVPHAQLPRTDRGKVDRAALARIPLPPGPPHRPPRSDWEIRIAQAWSVALGVEDPGVDHDFFELGGDSLAAQEVLTIIHSVGPDLPISVFADAPTIAGLARRAEEFESSGRRRGDVVRLRAPLSSRAPTVVCFCGAGGTAVAFEMLVRRLEPTGAVHAVEMHGLHRRAVPDWTVVGAARRFVRALPSLEVSGPLVLVGHSYGGLVAFEAAQQLRRRGTEVALLALLDSYVPAPPEPPGRGLRARAAHARHEFRRLLDVDNGRSDARTAARALSAGVMHRRGLDQFDVFFERGVAMSRRYRPGVYRGAAVVYAAAVNALPIDHLGWDHLFSGPWDLVTVPGDHHGILRRPHVDALADDLRARLPDSGT